MTINPGSLLLAASLVLVTAAHPGPATPATRTGSQVVGRIVITDRGDQAAQDVGQSVVWLEGEETPAEPAAADMITEDKQFLPHVLVIPAGSTVTFPNHDPF